MPRLSGPDAVEATDVRTAALLACRSLGEAADRWIVLGVDGPTRRLSAYGSEVPVSASPAADDLAAPLPMLLACWMRGESAPAATLEPMMSASDTSPEDAAAAGRALAAALAADPSPVGVLVVADGATALTPSAPGGGDRDSAHRLQKTIDDAIGAGDVAALARLDPAACDAEGVGGRVPLQVLAGLVDSGAVAGRPRVDVRYAGAPFGVGYTVATVRPAGIDR
ncbi:hypothetical protein ACFOJ6_21310 [Gordonia humi]|uniref:hypothetical protein n=1 Tax=Gordonia humi TaxID=686429 RepID=UPI00360B0E9D